MDKFINVKVLANPLNWLVVFAILMLLSVFGHFVLTWAGVSHTPDET